MELIAVQVGLPVSVDSTSGDRAQLNNNNNNNKKAAETSVDANDSV